MLKRLALTCALIVLLGYGLTHLFLMRFQSGDVFPPYTSLRTDPLGTKGFHDALDALPALDVRRNYRPIEKLKPKGPTTLIYAGTPHAAFWRSAEFRAVETMIQNGARVVITFLPVKSGPSREELEQSRRDEQQMREARGKQRKPRTPHPAGDETSKGEDPDKLIDPENADVLSFREVAARWGFAFAYLPNRTKEDPPTAQVKDSAIGLEPEISWRSVLHFQIKEAPWRTIYSSGGAPVLIERPYGRGSIVLAADSYFVSNEALWRERAPRLLAWLAGPSSTIVFDEESHGIKQSPGIASLVRRYHLGGVFAVLLLIAALFVWKNSAPLIPPHAEAGEEGNLVLGNEAGAGFVNLLRRSIPPAQILDTCAAEWRKTLGSAEARKTAPVVEEILAAERSKPARERSAVATYRKISSALRRKPERLSTHS